MRILRRHKAGRGLQGQLTDTVFRGFRIVDGSGDFFGSLVVDGGKIVAVSRGTDGLPASRFTIDGSGFPDTAVLMPAFVDLHAHFREPGFSEKETLESASLSAAAGGFATAVCMANTNPVTDTPERAAAIKARSDAIGIIDLYPAMSLTRNMEGKELSGLGNLASGGPGPVLMLSEDGRDVADDGLFLAAMTKARGLGMPVSCHCDFGGTEAVAAMRAIGLGMKAGCHVHVAHVSTRHTLDAIRRARKSAEAADGFSLTCEATPHHIGATAADAERMGDGFGRVNPPLATEDDRKAVLDALLDGTVDAVATDHAPHSHADKVAGSPGFVGLETAFAVCITHMGDRDMRLVSSLLSANPARILGLADRGTIAEGMRADLVVADTSAVWKVDPAAFRSRGRCTPFAGMELRGKILMTLKCGRTVFQEGFS